jgi:hypothetical protein
VAALLAAPGLTSTLGDRLQAADANGDGVISASEMIDVFQSEADAIRDNKMMKRALIALGVACLLIIAAVVGLTYAVVEMSKDTSVQNNVLVSKDGLQPLSTATLQKTVQLADLYKADSPSELDWLTHVTVPFGEGEAVLKIQNMYLVPGQSVRFDTAAEGVSVEVTADGVTVSGDEQAPGGRRRLMEVIMISRIHLIWIVLAALLLSGTSIREFSTTSIRESRTSCRVLAPWRCTRARTLLLELNRCVLCDNREGSTQVHAHAFNHPSISAMANAEKACSPDLPDIAELASTTPDLSTLLAAVQAMNLTDVLSTPGPIDVFAPTNDAFAALLSDFGITAEQLLAETDLVTRVLQLHVVTDGAVCSGRPERDGADGLGRREPGRHRRHGDRGRQLCDDRRVRGRRQRGRVPDRLGAAADAGQRRPVCRAAVCRRRPFASLDGTATGASPRPSSVPPPRTWHRADGGAGAGVHGGRGRRGLREPGGVLARRCLSTRKR